MVGSQARKEHATSAGISGDRGKAVSRMEAMGDRENTRGGNGDVMTGA